MRYTVLTTFAMLGALVISAPVAGAAPSVPAGFALTKVADAPPGAGSCDDLAFLDGNLYFGCQNATLSSGGGGSSTLVEVSPSGATVKTWPIKDKIDGVGSDPAHHRLIVTLNEDLHSHLVTVSPSAPTSQQLVNYTYSPDPGSPSTPAALHTGGGTDSVSVDANGNILITGSHAKTPGGTAVFTVTLTPPSTSGSSGTATLRPTFSDNATAQKGSGGSATLKLTDVDSGAIVPASSPRFPGAYVIDDQTALELVFAGNIFHGTGLTVVKTAYGLDDLRWATSDHGTLYVVDLGAGTPGKSAIYKVTGPFIKNTVFASNDSISDQVVTVNLGTGALKPFIRGLNTTKGLVYVDPSGTETALTLTGSSKPAAATTSGGGTATKSSSSSNTGLIVGIVVAAIVLLGITGYAVARRRQA